jgi:hypothetical protein
MRDRISWAIVFFLYKSIVLFWVLGFVISHDFLVILFVCCNWVKGF